MSSTDRRIDAYIAQAQPFAQPILKALRALVHRAVPEVQETIKWGMPFFEHHGRLAHMAAFKAHAVFTLFEAGRVLRLAKNGSKAMGSFGRITARRDLPGDAALVKRLRQAAAANQSGKARKKRRPAKRPVVPASIARALAKDAKAKAGFAALAPSHQREYLDWIGEAKTEPTRARRLATMLAWVAEGKHMGRRYERR